MKEKGDLKSMIDYARTKSLAEEKRESAHIAIQGRLRSWSERTWIQNTDSFFRVLERFRREYIQNDSFEMKCLEYWECGLGQILDLHEKEICSLLPYLLTAYVYNFPHKNNKFVLDFLEIVKKNKIDKEFDWSARREEDFQRDLIQKDEYYYAIGKLLTSSCDLFSPSSTERKRHAGRFLFPKIVQFDVDFGSLADDMSENLSVQFIQNGSPYDPFYSARVELEKHRNSFYYPNIRLPMTNDKDDELYPNALLLSEEKYSHFSDEINYFKFLDIFAANNMYRRDRLVSIFCYFYAISSVLLHNRKSRDTLINYLLILEAFDDQSGIDRLKSFIDEKPEKDIIDSINSVLVSNYRKLKLSVQLRKNIEDEKNKSDSNNEDVTAIE